MSCFISKQYQSIFCAKRKKRKFLHIQHYSTRLIINNITQNTKTPTPATNKQAFPYSRYVYLYVLLICIHPYGILGGTVKKGNVENTKKQARIVFGDISLRFMNSILKYALRLVLPSNTPRQIDENEKRTRLEKFNIGWRAKETDLYDYYSIFLCGILLIFHIHNVINITCLA